MLAIIPARGGSKRIPDKNVREIAGQPMISWVIETALRSNLFEEVLVSTDSPMIASVAQSWGASAPFLRPAELSDDFTGTLDVMAHAASWVVESGRSPERVCCLYATACLLLPEDLKRGQDLLLEGWDYVCAASLFQRSVQRAFQRDERGALRLLFPELRLTRTQDLPPAYFDCGQFYWGNITAWLQRRPILGERTSFVELPPERAIDVDTMEDWAVAEAALMRRNAREGV